MGIRRFFQRRTEDADLTRELEAHIAHQVDERIAEPSLRLGIDAGDGLVQHQQLGIAREPTSVTGRLETAATHPLTISRGVVRRVIGR